MDRMATTKEFVGGLLLVGLAAFFVLFGWKLRVGSPSHMGPGFIPMGISAMLALIGITKIVLALRRVGVDNDTPSAALRPLFFVALAPVVFGLMISPMGIVVTVGTVALLARLAMAQRFLLSDLVIAIGISAFCALVFVVFLGQAIPLWPRWV